MMRAAAWLASLVAAALAGAALAQGTRQGTAPGLDENRREVRQMAEMFDIVRHAEAELRPSIQAALADGKLDDDEKKALKSKVMDLVRLHAQDELKGLAKICLAKAVSSNL